MKVYHGSPDTFDKIDFDKCNSIGFHTGTLEHALFVLSDKYTPDVHGGTSDFMNMSIYEIEIDPRDYITVEVSDIFGISSEDVRLLEELSEKYPWIDVEYKLTEEKYSQFSISHNLKETLKRCGIKYIKYENMYEGEGYSYVILDDSIKLKRYRLKEFLQGIYKKHLVCDI